MEKEENIKNIGEISSETKNEPIGIRVKTMDSSEMLVKAFPMDSILTLKEKISQKINLEPNR